MTPEQSRKYSLAKSRLFVREIQAEQTRMAKQLDAITQSLGLSDSRDFSAIEKQLNENPQLKALVDQAEKSAQNIEPAKVKNRMKRI